MCLKSTLICEISKQSKKKIFKNKCRVFPNYGVIEAAPNMLYLLVKAVPYVKRIYLFYTFFKLVWPTMQLTWFFTPSAHLFFECPVVVWHS